MWHVYAKIKGYWTPIGSPCSKAQALAHVEAMIKDGGWQEPHCVPL